MSTLPHRTDRDSLKRKADYFFTSKACRRLEVQEFASKLRGIGATVAIGGLLRDLHLGGIRRFKSDVDFVVQAASGREFERFVAAFGGQRNRFGGFSLRLQRWKVDVWPLERTWAAAEGHLKVTKLDGLLGATFFDWDAILYSLDERRLIHRPTYFDPMHTRILDINLEANPNPLGNAVRAVRYASRWKAALGWRLAEHVLRQVTDNGWSGLVADELRGFSNPMLHTLDGDRIAARLATFDRGSVTIVEPDLGELPLEDGGDVRDERRGSPATPKLSERRLAWRVVRPAARRACTARGSGIPPADPSSPKSRWS